jgi:hypothetical protein
VPTTQLSRLVKAPRAHVYSALLDADALQRWMDPEGMTSEVHTELVAMHENVPPGVSPEANELGWRMSIDKLASLVEGHGFQRGRGE